MAYSNLERHKLVYAKLLRLYPKTYRRQFAEPMLQMFADMLSERAQDGRATRGLASRVYAETLIGVLTQHVEEIIVNIKTTKSKIIIGAGLVSVIAVGVILSNRPAAQLLQPGLGFEQVQQLSKGGKSACTANVASAASAVKHDDGFVVYKGNKFSNFESTAGSAISDVPAGTNYNLTINTYADKIVKGTMTYEKGYGMYNYTIKKLPDTGQWQLMSIVACKK